MVSFKLNEDDLNALKDEEVPDAIIDMLEKLDRR